MNIYSLLDVNRYLFDVFLPDLNVLIFIFDKFHLRREKTNSLLSHTLTLGFVYLLLFNHLTFDIFE